jgi:tetratricopeptide (TPR) repeat protein/O-antigen ligase
MSRLQRYAEGTLEACWLLALIAAPLFFNTYSARVFEPDKIAIIRSLALVALAAWLTKVLATGQRPSLDWRAAGRAPLLAPVVALIAVYLLATVLSLAPAITLFGSYQRMQGTYSTLSYIALGLAVAANLRTRSQIERILTTVIVTSLPISLYGIMQRYLLDPMPWGGDTVNRVTGHMGNAIFLGAYLIMAAMATLGRIVTGFRDVLTKTGSTVGPMARTAVYVSLFVLNFVALWFTQSRGPFGGWVIGLYFFGMLLCLYYRLRWVALGLTGLALAGGVFMLLLNLSVGPLAQLAEVRGFDRLAQMLSEFEGRTGTGRVRVLIWTGVVQLVQPHEPLQQPDGTPDPWNAIRPLIGYGPETLHVAYNRFYPPELGTLEARNASPDRSHNEAFDSVATTGLVGLIAYLSLFTAIFYFGLDWMGLVSTRARKVLFFVLWFGMGLLGSVLVTSLQGLQLVGIGLPIGLILGMSLFLAVAEFLPADNAERPQLEPWRAIAIVVFLAAIAAHFFEIHLGIAIVSTRTHFAIFLGALWVLGYWWPRNVKPEAQAAALATSRASVESGAGGRRRRSTAGAAARPQPVQLAVLWPTLGLVAAIAITLSYTFINNAAQSRSMSEILGNALTQVFGPAGAQTSYGIMWLMVGSLVVACVLGLIEDARARNLTVSAAHIGIGLAVSGLVWLISMIMFANQHAALANREITSLEALLASAHDVAGLLTTYYLLLLLVGLAFALGLAQDRRTTVNLASSGVAAFAGGVLMVLAVLLSASLNLSVIQADIVYKNAQQIDDSGRPDLAIELYRQVQTMAPNQDFYYLFLGRAYLSVGSALLPDQRDSQFGEAERKLIEARAINPYNTDHTANLARLNRQWARLTEDPALRAQRGQASDQYYAQAVRLSPQNAGLWNEWGLVSYELLGNATQAEDHLSRSLEIDPTFDQTYLYLGDFRSWQASQLADETERAALFALARDAYQQGLDRNQGQGPAATSMRIGLATTYVNTQQINLAIQQYEAVAQTNTLGQNQWQVLFTIATLYAQQNDSARARDYATQALNLAPEPNRPEIQGFIDALP